MVSFIRKTFVLVKLKIVKALRTDSASMKLLFLEVVLQQTKTLFEKTWRIRFFMKKWRAQSLQFWSSLDPVSPWRWLKSKKISSSWEKLQPLDYPNMSKSRLYLVSPFQENTITFCNIWAIFARKQGRDTNQKIKIKIWQNFVNL